MPGLACCDETAAKTILASVVSITARISQQFVAGLSGSSGYERERVATYEPAEGNNPGDWTKLVRQSATFGELTPLCAPRTL